MFAVAATHTSPASHTSLRQHVRRAVGRDHSPLCRPLDRAYSRLAAVQALTVLAALALAAVAALLAFRVETHTAEQIARHRHLVTAVTTGPAQADNPRVGSARDHAPARWTYPAGPGTGTIPVPEGTRAGTAVPIGLDDAGTPIRAPKATEQIASDAVLIGLGTVSVLAVVTEGVFALRRRTLERRADTSWEAAWERVEPGWSGRR
ncbi:hypothetical protein ACFVHB_37200 [Kitasatospora sp. NPDC127111]|uniref:Rv1733c family protein n=1 Tax=Kitasatospora sp. NPDC127111 TaxID=3345363 RepID=UPI003632431B